MYIQVTLLFWISYRQHTQSLVMITYDYHIKTFLVVSRAAMSRPS